MVSYYIQCYHYFFWCLHCPLLDRWGEFQQASLSPWSIFLILPLLSGSRRSRLILDFPCPSPGISPLSKEFLFSYRKWYLDAKIGVWGVGCAVIGLHLSATPPPAEYMPISTYKHTHMHTYIHFFTPLHLCSLLYLSTLTENHEFTQTQPKTYHRIYSSFLHFYIHNSLLWHWETWLPLAWMQLHIWLIPLCVN